jgi:SAM-dependent methyltransferase
MIINFHNVLGFVSSPKNALAEMSRLLKKGGILVSVVPNTYHGIYFNITVGRIGAAKSLAEGEDSTFHDSMPKMHFFTPDMMRKLYAGAGIADVGVYGFPVTLYPNLKETTIKDSTKSLNDILSGETLGVLSSIEEKLVLNEEACSRGNNLFAIGRKG